MASTDADAAAKTLKSTAREKLDFVSNFTTAQQWKRRPETDESDPYTPEERLAETFTKYSVKKWGHLCNS